MHSHHDTHIVLLSTLKDNHALNVVRLLCAAVARAAAIRLAAIRESYQGMSSAETIIYPNTPTALTLLLNNCVLVTAATFGRLS
jgi:hypothetical protein